MNNSYFRRTAIAALAALTIACGNHETEVIDKFFGAVQANDNQTVSSFSMVPFDKPVKSWKVKSVGEEQKVPAPLAGLSTGLKAADEAVTQNKKEAGAYFNAHPLEVDKVKPLVEAGTAVTGALQKTAEDWKKFNDADKDLKTKAAEAKIAYDREKRLVTMSVGQAAVSDNLVGDLITKTAVVEVESEGDVKTYAIQLRKYDVAPGGQGPKTQSRWLIQSITPQ
ncbi:MAG: hypothetical protein ABI672_19325 [Vicinamibacteria bacterium]